MKHPSFICEQQGLATGVNGKMLSMAGDKVFDSFIYFSIKIVLGIHSLEVSR